MMRVFFFAAFLVVALAAPRVYAQTSVSPTPVITEGIVEMEAAESTPAAKDEVNYTMPYPGILPDHPLYFLKAARDRIISILINDPIKKAEFNVLQADKRLAAGQALIKKNKGELAVSTISKGNNYYHQAIQLVEQARKDNKEAYPILDKMRASLKMHDKLLKDMESEIDTSFRSGLGQEHKRAQDFLTTVEKNIAQIN